MIPIALTIAGSDSSGGAGIQADLKTFSALGVYGASVITALTAQNTRGVTAVHVAPPEMILAQMEAVFSDLDVRAVKIGMVGDEAAIGTVADGLERFCRAPVVLDPVMVSTTGAALLAPGAERALIERLFPLAGLITPNIPEAARLLGVPMAATQMQAAAQTEALLKLGAKAVLLKGGHLDGPESADFYDDGAARERLAAPRTVTKNTHGTGCTLSAAIAANLALGQSMHEAVGRAKGYLTGAIAHADALHIGSGTGPVHHFYKLWR